VPQWRTTSVQVDAERSRAEQLASARAELEVRLGVGSLVGV